MDQVGQHYPAFWPRFLTWMTDWRGGWHHQWCLQRQKKKKEEDPQPQLRTQRIDLWQKRSALKGVKEWRVELKQPVCRHVLNSEKIKCVREKTCKGRRPLFTPRCHISRWQWPRVTSLGEKGANYSLRCLIIWEFSAIVSERLLKKNHEKTGARQPGCVYLSSQPEVWVLLQAAALLAQPPIHRCSSWGPSPETRVAASLWMSCFQRPSHWWVYHLNRGSNSPLRNLVIWAAAGFQLSIFFKKDEFWITDDSGLKVRFLYFLLFMFQSEETESNVKYSEALTVLQCGLRHALSFEQSFRLVHRRTVGDRGLVAVGMSLRGVRLFRHRVIWEKAKLEKAF